MRQAFQFPLRSRAAMTQYLAEHDSYWPMNSWNGGFVLSWNVKVYDAAFCGKTGSEPVNPAYDERWDEHLEDNENLFWQVCKDAARYLLDGDYSTYPGNDHGAYQFMLNGRCGGHLCLMRCDIVPQPRRWRLGPFVFDGRDHWHDYLADLPFGQLRKLYKAVACMDQDFSRENVTAEISFRYNLFRWQWEADLEAALEDNARELEASRPDLYSASATAGATHSRDAIARPEAEASATAFFDSEAKKPYSVLLLYPDYANDSGTKTYYAFVEALDPIDAIAQAQDEAASSYEWLDRDPEDYAPLLVTSGHNPAEPLFNQ